MVKVQFEYVINCSPKVLYNRLSSASGLAEWFADDVSVRGNRFTFKWDGAEQEALMTLHKENRLVRFNWIDDEDIYFAGNDYKALITAFSISEIATLCSMAKRIQSSASGFVLMGFPLSELILTFTSPY